MFFYSEVSKIEWISIQKAPLNSEKLAKNQPFLVSGPSTWNNKYIQLQGTPDILKVEVAE